MSIELIRVDERLLHGQVVVGWGQRLGIGYYVVADDGLAEADWERRLVASGVPAEAEALFLPVEAVVHGFGDLDARNGTGALITRGTGGMRRLAEAGYLEGRTVTLGCLGPAAERKRALDYIHLTGHEIRDLRTMVEHGARVVARDLPGSRAVKLSELLTDVDRA